MELKHDKHEGSGVFYLEENKERVALLSYVFSDAATLIIEHTIVNSGNEGKGLGKQLVDAAVNLARENNYKIVPLCSYAKKVIEKSDGHKDVL